MKGQVVFLHDQQDKVVTMLPKGFASIIATTPEALLEKVTQYTPDIVFILPSLIQGEPWEWMDRLQQLDLEAIFIRATTEEEYHFYLCLQKWFPILSIIPPILSEEEISYFLSHLALNQEIPTESSREPKTRAFVGTGGTGITTFLLMAAPWFGLKHPEKKILLVDMNEDKRDLSVALSAQAARLSLWQAYLARGNEQFSPFGVQHPTAPNVSVISAVQSWESQELTTFLSVVRRDYDEIWFDVSRPNHVPRLMDEVDEIIYVVRPDGLCLTGMKRIAKPEWSNKAKLLVTQLDERFANASEISSFLSVKVMGSVPYEFPLLSLSVQHEISLSKKMKKSLEKLDWGITVAPQEGGSRLRNWMAGWKK